MGKVTKKFKYGTKVIQAGGDLLIGDNLRTGGVSKLHGKVSRQMWHNIWPNLPAEEMAAARSMLNPRMIALSITCRLDDAFMHDEFHPSGPLFRDGGPLVVGGQAAEGYRSLVEAGGGLLCATNAQFPTLPH